jgi:hypothetical protein
MSARMGADFPMIPHESTLFSRGCKSASLGPSHVRPLRRRLYRRHHGICLDLWLPKRYQVGRAGSKSIDFHAFHGVFFGNQHDIWSKQHNGKVRGIQYSRVLRSAMTFAIATSAWAWAPLSFLPPSTRVSAVRARPAAARRRVPVANPQSGVLGHGGASSTFRARVPRPFFPMCPIILVHGFQCVLANGLTGFCLTQMDRIRDKKTLISQAEMGRFLTPFLITG